MTSIDQISEECAAYRENMSVYNNLEESGGSVWNFQIMPVRKFPKADKPTRAERIHSNKVEQSQRVEGAIWIR